MNQWKIIKLECNQIVFDGVCLKCRLLGSVPDLLSKKMLPLLLPRWTARAFPCFSH